MARKKNKAITINRNRYNDIKRMDHGSMEAISQIKGIGPVKVQQIKLALIAAGAKDTEKAAGGQNA